jgi:hypothetical protein
MGMKDVLSNLVKNTGNYLLDISSNELPSKTDPIFNEIYKKCRNYTMTSQQQLYSLYTATRYVIENKIPGDIVECGVWKGGSSMLAALTLLSMENTDKYIYLYDTYQGMTEPTKHDISDFEEDSKRTWKLNQKEDFNKWCYSPIEEVQRNLFSTGYPDDKLVFVKGKVENTIPHTVPLKISLLRLDTDWYVSTYHELKHLFPNLSENGVLIIDDYGHWKGSRKAVDEYLAENNIKLLLNAIDYTGRIAIKPKL